MVTAGSPSPRVREGFLEGGALNLLENSRDGFKMVVGVQEEEKTQIPSGIKLRSVVEVRVGSLEKALALVSSIQAEE